MPLLLLVPDHSAEEGRLRFLDAEEWETACGNKGGDVAAAGDLEAWTVDGGCCAGIWRWSPIQRLRSFSLLRVR